MVRLLLLYSSIAIPLQGNSFGSGDQSPESRHTCSCPRVPPLMVVPCWHWAWQNSPPSQLSHAMAPLVGGCIGTQLLVSEIGSLYKVSGVTNIKKYNKLESKKPTRKLCRWIADWPNRESDVGGLTCLVDQNIVSHSWQRRIRQPFVDWRG